METAYGCKTAVASPSAFRLIKSKRTCIPALDLPSRAPLAHMCNPAPPRAPGPQVVVSSTEALRVGLQALMLQPNTSVEDTGVPPELPFGMGPLVAEGSSTGLVAIAGGQHAHFSSLLCCAALRCAERMEG